MRSPSGIDMMPASFWLFPLCLWTGTVFAEPPAAADFPRIEVFTLSGQPIAANAAATSPQVDVQQYELDRIHLIETRLSRSLPADPKQARAIVLDRLQHLDRVASDSLQQTATGLAKAMQYGIDRIPAIVFYRQAVVYGVTDVQIALDYYRAWKSEERP